MEFERTSEDVRPLPSDDPQSTRRFLRALLSGPRAPDTNASDTDEEEKTIDFFDGVIREHDDINVFTAGPAVHTDDTDDDE